MPKPWEEQVRRSRKLSTDRAHRMQVVWVKKIRKPRSILVCLLHLDGGDGGRKHHARLPLPIVDEGITAEFLQASGIVLNPDGRVNPGMAVGAVLRVRLLPADDGCYRPVEFQPDKELKQHESGASE